MSGHDTHVGAVVVGAGIVGLATARALQRARPGWPVVVLEREARVAAHQSGHNSGVLHSPVTYRPGSHKARLCAQGQAALVDWCAEHGVALERCGEVVVATEPDEVPRLAALAERARANGLVVHELGPAGLADLEPHARGLAALHVPATGVVDFPGVCEGLRREIEDHGGEVRLGVGVQDLVDTRLGVAVDTDQGRWWAERVVTCAGAWSDVVARRSGLVPPVRILPFRGEYLELRPEAAHLVNHLVYPVPDPRFPFLGVHFTRGIDGTVHAGPNAVPALGRDAYGWGTVRAGDTARFAARRSTWRLARRYWRTGAGEIVRSLDRRRFVAALQRLVPEVRPDDLVPAGAGVRAQAVAADGTLVDDFAFARSGPVLHVVNAPSPAATASLAIGAAIAGWLLDDRPADTIPTC
nr:L-2-hydroxyglutarate oxidase [Rhabdothermincola salaria]